MVGYDLIDSYLDTLRDNLRWRRDAADVVAEARDHLYSAAEGLEADGVSPVVAQRQTLGRFGDPSVVATALAISPRGGIALPTEFTRSAGLFAICAAGLWMVFPLTWLASLTLEDRLGDWTGPPQLVWMLGAMSVLFAAVLTFAVTLGLRVRHGGLGLLGLGGIVLVGLGAAASILSWFVFGWGTLFAMGVLLVVVEMWRVDVAPRSSMLALAVAWPVAGLTWTILRAREVGGADEWGDYPVANVVGVGVGTALFAIGLVGLGRWLLSEEAADLHSSEEVVTA